MIDFSRATLQRNPSKSLDAMSRITLLTYLLLTVVFGSSAFPVRQLYRRVTKDPGKQYLTAPELFHDRNFAIATISNSENSISTLVEIVLVMTDARCSLTIPLEDNAIKTGVDSIRWLKDGSILMAAYYEFEDASRKIRLVLVDMQNCEHSYPYIEFFPASYKIFTSAVATNGHDNQFAVLVHDKIFCGGVGWCRFVYNSLDENAFESLDFDFPWEGSDVQPATAPDGTLFVVRIHEPATRTHKIRLYHTVRRWHRAPMYEELLSVASNEGVEAEKYLMPGRTGILSSGLSVCWISKWNARTIHCSKFDEQGRMLFNKTLNFPEPLMLFHVKSVADGLLLLTKKYECNDESCMDVYATEIVNKYSNIRDSYLDFYDSNMPQADDIQQIRYRKMRIECSHPELIQAQVYECADDAVGRVYVCDNDERLLYHYIAVRHHTSLFY